MSCSLSYTVIPWPNASGSAAGAASLSPEQLSLQSQSEILELPRRRRRSRYSPAESPQKRILLGRYPPLLHSRADSSRCKSAEQQRLSKCRQSLQLQLQRCARLALPAQEGCLRRRCSSVRPSRLTRDEHNLSPAGDHDLGKPMRQAWEKVIRIDVFFRHKSIAVQLRHRPNGKERLAPSYLAEVAAVSHPAL